ncbi:MAG: zf-HC2 domain-containing protein [Planctomycetes bacterium]|nr:zf-HC2 domain-containing protein [Planctomycetota bacterium]
MNGDCDAFLTLASGGLDGELDAQERERLAEHLRSCAACGERLARMERSVLSLREARAVRAPTGLRERCLPAVAVRNSFSWSRLAAGLLIGGGLFATGAWITNEPACDADAKSTIDHLVRVIGAEPDAFEERAELALVRALQSRRNR